MEGLQTSIPEWMLLTEFSVSIGLCALVIPIIFWYNARRKIFPISGGDPLTLICIGHLAWISKLNDALTSFVWYPCPLSQTIRVLAYTSTIFGFMIRAWMLLYRFKVTTLLVELNEKKKENRSSAVILESWWVRYRWLVRPWVLILVFSINLLLAISYLTFDYFKDHKSGDWCPLVYPQLFSNNASRLHILVLSLLSVFLAYKLYHVKGNDAYGVKEELKWCSLNIIIWQIIYAVWSYRVGYVALVQNGFEYWYRLFAALPIIYWSFIRPIYRSYKWQKQQNAPPPLSLSHVLSNESGVSSFLTYLKKEFSTENLLFYLHVSSWLELSAKHPLLVPCDPPTLSPRSTSSPSKKAFFSFSPSTPTSKSDSPLPPLCAQPSSSDFLSSLASSASSAPASSTPNLMALPNVTTWNNSPTHSSLDVIDVRHSSIDVKLEQQKQVLQIDIELSQRAYALLETFLQINSKFSINLSAAARKQAIDAVESFGSSGQTLDSLQELITAFENAKREIFHLMECDSFQRYSASADYEIFRKQQLYSGQSPHTLQNLNIIVEEEKKNASTKRTSKSSSTGTLQVLELYRPPPSPSPGSVLEDLGELREEDGLLIRLGTLEGEAGGEAGEALPVVIAEA